MRLRAAALLVSSGLLFAASAGAVVSRAPLGLLVPETPVPPALPDPLEPLPPALAKDELEAAVRLVREWARAWSEQRVEDFLALYAEDFRCPDGWPRESWERKTRERLSGAKPAEMSIHRLEVRSLGAGRLTIHFLQLLGSGSSSRSVEKTLELVRREGGWEIVEERALPP